MQIAAETANCQSLPSAMLSEFSATVRQSQYSEYRVIRCNGAVTRFEPSEIPVTATRVFLAADGMQGAASAGLQPQGIDDGTRRHHELRGLTATAPSWNQLIGPVG